MRIEHIAIGINPPDDVNVVVEIPIGGEPIKYELDKASGALIVDRFLYTSMRYPGNYGFVPHTLCGDGDPLDVLIASTRALVPGCVINCRPIGVLVMEDEAGTDEKVKQLLANYLIVGPLSFDATNARFKRDTELMLAVLRDIGIKPE